MTVYEVIDILFEESSFSEALLLLLTVLLVYFIVFRRRFSSVFDPLVYVLALSSVAQTMLLLMVLHELASITKLSFVAACLGLFYAGFLFVDTSEPRAQSGNPLQARAPLLRQVAGGTLAVLFFVELFVLATTYTFFGVPLFLESRLSQFVDSGGFGVLNRLQTGLEFSSLVLAFVALRQRTSAAGWAWAILIQFLISGLLSGSKGSLLSLLFAWYLARVYQVGGWHPIDKLPKSMIILIALLGISPLLVIWIQNREAASSLGATLQLLALRIAAEGDPYAYFLGGDAIDAIARHDWLAPLRPVLVALRLGSPESSVNPGFEIVREILGVDAPAAGPNSRLAIYLLYFYGFGGIVLAPLLGMTLGLARNFVGRRVRGSPMSFAVAAAVYLHFCKLEVDPQLTIAGLFGLGLVLPIFWLARFAGGVRLKPPVPRRVQLAGPEC